MALKDSLRNTNLDIESNIPLGGPNRTKSANIPGGTYINIKATNTYNFPPSFTPAIEMDPNSPFSPNIQNNSDIQLHRYLPNDIPGGKTYLDIMNTDPENL